MSYSLPLTRNRELQTHVDLVVTRMRRLLGLTPESDHWRPWIDGYTKVLVLLERGDPQAAITRYRQIYAEACNCSRGFAYIWMYEMTAGHEPSL